MNQFTDAQVVGILQQAEKGEQTIAEVCRQHNISENSFPAGAVASAARTPARPPVSENSRRRTPVSSACSPSETWRSTSIRSSPKRLDAAADPVQERRQLVVMANEHGLSQPQTCELADIARSSLRYEAKPDQEGPITQELRQIRDAYPRFGIRRAQALLRARGQAINHKRVQRLWRKNGFVESFHGKLRDEFLSREVFASVKEAQVRLTMHRRW